MGWATYQLVQHFFHQHYHPVSFTFDESPSIHLPSLDRQETFWDRCWPLPRPSGPQSVIGVGDDEMFQAEIEIKSTKTGINLMMISHVCPFCFGLETGSLTLLRHVWPMSGHGVPIRLIRTSVADVQGLVREFGDIVLTLGGNGGHGNVTWDTADRKKSQTTRCECFWTL